MKTTTMPITSAMGHVPCVVVNFYHDDHSIVNSHRIDSKAVCIKLISDLTEDMEMAWPTEKTLAPEELLNLVDEGGLHEKKTDEEM